MISSDPPLLFYIFFKIFKDFFTENIIIFMTQFSLKKTSWGFGGIYPSIFTLSGQGYASKYYLKSGLYVEQRNLKHFKFWYFFTVNTEMLVPSYEQLEPQV